MIRGAKGTILGHVPSPSFAVTPLLVDLLSQHDQRREQRAEQHAGDLAMPTHRNGATKIDQLDHKISRQEAEGLGGPRG